MAVVSEYGVPIGVIWNEVRIEENEEMNTRVVYRNQKVIHQSKLDDLKDILIRLVDDQNKEIGEATLQIEKSINEFNHFFFIADEPLQAVVEEHKKLYFSWKVELVNPLSVQKGPKNYFFVFDRTKNAMFFDGRDVKMFTKSSSPNELEFERCKAKFTLKKSTVDGHLHLQLSTSEEVFERYEGV